MPAEPWAFIAVCSFWGWVAAAIGLSLSFRSAENPFDPASVARWGGVLTVLFLLWVVAMRLA